MPPEVSPSEISPLLGPQSNGPASYSSTSGGGGGQSDPELAKHGRTGEEEDADKDSPQRAVNVRYIFPAVSIGVRAFLIPAQAGVRSLLSMLTPTRSSYLRPTKQSSWPAMERLVLTYTP